MTARFEQAREAARAVFNNPDGKGPIFREWLEFHKANRHVYDLYVHILREAKTQRGYTNWSISGATEVLRWQTSITTNGSAFKLPNEFRAYYSRLIQMKEEDLFDFLDCSRSRADIEMGWRDFLTVMKPPKPPKRPAARVSDVWVDPHQNYVGD